MIFNEQGLHTNFQQYLFSKLTKGLRKLYPECSSMSKVRQTYIKRLAKDLVSADSERFSEDFEENKQELKDTEEFESKKLRNRVAGYIVRVVQNSRE